MHRLDWQQGEYGKGLVDQHGGVHTWNEDEYPVHADYLGQYPEIKPQGQFYIEPHGAVDVSFPHPSYDGREAHDRMMQHILDADPALSEGQKDSWNFG